jgi:O-antigen/teichoic acid export membrane protein
MEGFKKYFKNTSWLLGNRAYGMLIGFFVSVLVTRYLGVENYGTLSYAISFVGLFSFIANLGIEQVLYRDLIKHKHKENELIGTAILLRLVSGSVAMLIAITFAYLTKEQSNVMFLITVISISFIFQAFNVINYAFQARVQAKFPSIATFIVVSILAILKLIVVLGGKGFYYFAVTHTLESLLYGIIFLYFYKKYYGSPLNWKFDKRIAREMLVESAPLLLSTVFVSIYSRIDQVLLGNMINVSAVGIYDVAIRLSELWYFIPTILVGSLFPSIVNAKNTDEKVYAKRFISLTLMLVSLSAITGLIVTVFAHLMLSILYGQEFIGGYRVLQLYVWSGIGMSLGMVLNQFLITEKLARTILYTSIIGMVLNLALNLILIPKYGINGSAFATLVSYIVGPLSVVVFPEARRKILRLIKAART